MIRRFKESDANTVSALVARTLREVNIKDYSAEYIERDVKALNPEFLIKRTQWTHSYVACEDDKVVGCGSICPYCGKEDESILLTIFVLPEYQGKGIGTKIIKTLEKDEFFLRAKRIEIPSSITACQFYRKLGYDYKDGINKIDDDQLYRLEKFNR